MENSSLSSSSPMKTCSPSSPPSPWQQVLLPPAVEQLINQICANQNKPTLRLDARRALFQVGEDIAINKILRDIASKKIRKSFDGYVLYLAEPYVNNVNSPSKRQCLSPTRFVMTRGGSNSDALEALGELEFRKAFLILSYLGRMRLEEMITPEEIRASKNLKMGKFEEEVWRKVGYKCGYIREQDRLKYCDWDSGKKTYVYHCHVATDGSYLFRGPFLVPKKNFLQRALGDDNVLMVKFGEENGSHRSSTDQAPNYYRKVARDGIVVGLRCYRFFVFKDGGKGEKKKDPTTSQVKCYFVCTESNASIDRKDYVLSGKTVREARSLFMHVDGLPSLSSYMARFSLILSKTDNVEIDFATVDIRVEDDVPCLDRNGNLVKDKDDKTLIHTDGTGFISEDLALRCLESVNKREHADADILEGDFPSIKLQKSHCGELPLLFQFRLFHNGRAVKGTFLLNKMLHPQTIVIRPSMIKVKTDEKLLDMHPLNSLEIVGMSKPPKKVHLSRHLIALLSYGGVTNEFFMKLLENALDDAQSVLSNKFAALRAIENGEMDDFILGRMILSGIPLEESYLQYRLIKLMHPEKNSLKDGKIPISESYYLIGTADPTGVLEDGEVCFILDKGQVSGRVLVYRHPGLHFGDIHVLKATYVEALEKFVGSSKYAIFFPSKGPRSLADEIAGGDFDGDMYLVSTNPQLLEMFKQSEPWTSSSPAYKIPCKKPSEFSAEDLEHELFELFLTNRFNPSFTVGLASDSWLSIMDRFLTLGDDLGDEKACMRKNLIQLVDIYYDALDAPKKGGKKIQLDNELKEDVFPHYMEKKELTYKSTSILGLIYDKVKSVQEEKLAIEIRKLPCFDDEEVNESYRAKWEGLFDNYKTEMSSAVERKKKNQDNATDAVINKYKQILYDAPEFEESNKCKKEIFQEALAIYDVVYNRARMAGKASYCNFAWRVAGSALFRLHMIKNNDRPFIGSLSVAKQLFG